MRLSIVYTTKRKGGLDILEDNLRRQHVLHDLLHQGEVELVAIDEHADNAYRRRALYSLANRIGFMTFWHVCPGDYEEPRFSKRMRARNCGLYYAKGTYVFFLDDYIWIPDNTIGRMLMKAENEPPLFFLTAAVDRTLAVTLDHVRGTDYEYSIFEDTFQPSAFGFPDVPIARRDPRAAADDAAHVGAYSRNPFLWNQAVALAPRQLLGVNPGYDEDFDHGEGHGEAEFVRYILKREKQAQIYFMKTLRAVALETSQFWTDAPGLRQAAERNLRIELERVRDNA